MTFAAIAFLICQTPAPSTGSNPPTLAASQPKATTGQADLTVRVIQADKKGTALDAQLKDLVSSLKPLAYTHYVLKQATNVSLKVDGSVHKLALMPNRTLMLSARELRAKPKKSVHVQIEIPELKFKTHAWIASGSNLVVGGPKFEEGVLIFAVGATKIEQNTPSTTADKTK